MSVENRIGKIERKVDVSARDISALVQDTRRIYTEIRHAQRLANQAVRVSNLLLSGAGATSSMRSLQVFGRFGFLFSFVFSVVQMALDEWNRQQAIQAAKDRQQLRAQLIRDLKSDADFQKAVRGRMNQSMRSQMP